MINSFMKFLQENECLEEYKELITEHKKDPGDWMDGVEPYQLIYSGFPYNDMGAEAQGKWGTLHRKWYKWLKETGNL